MELAAGNVSEGKYVNIYMHVDMEIESGESGDVEQSKQH